MGKKINPNIFRFIKYHNYYSIWFSKKFNYSKNIQEDKQIRYFFKNILKKKKIIFYEVYLISIKRKINLIYISIYIISKKFFKKEIENDINKLKFELQKKIHFQNLNIQIKKLNIIYLYPNILSKFILKQLKKKVVLNKILKKTINLTENIQNIKGIKIIISGKIYNKEKSYNEYIKEGFISLQSIQSKIYYNLYKIKTIYGVFSIKIWIFLI